jgi:hypothetical protein
MRYPFLTAAALLTVAALAAEPIPTFTLEANGSQLALRNGDAMILPLAAWPLGEFAGKAAAVFVSVPIVRGGSAGLVKISLTGKNHAMRSLNVLVAKSLDEKAWRVVQEWTADKSEDDSGSKDESQTITCDGQGLLLRRVHRLNVDNITFVLPCKCCTSIQTRTVETVEEESYAWNDTRKQLERRASRKWYVTQPGEGLLAVARKALGDPTRLARLYTLNPELREDGNLTEGQKVLVSQVKEK